MGKPVHYDKAEGLGPSDGRPRDAACGFARFARSVAFGLMGGGLFATFFHTDGLDGIGPICAVVGAVIYMAVLYFRNRAP